MGALTAMFFMAVSHATPAVLSQKTTTMAVMPFAAQDGESQAWLSKGLADLFIRHLANIPSISVVERDRLKTFTDEIGLSEAPLFNKQKALEVGRVARVDEVLYGNYTLKNDRITLTIFILNLKTQDILHTEEASGTMAQLRALVEQLTRKLLEKHGKPLTKQELALLAFRPTDSVAATERFYRGLDQYDHGHYADALAEFLLASKQDAHFLDAALWSGRMYEFSRQTDHAILRYQTLAETHAGEVEALDALLFSADLLASRPVDRDKAMAIYKRVLQNADDTPEGMLAAFKLSRLVDSVSAYALLQKVIDRRASAEERGIESLPHKTRTSRFFRWEDILPLYADALVQQVLLYGPMLERMKTPPPAPRGTWLVNPAKPEIGERFGTTPSLLHGGVLRDDWREELYAVVAPPGYVVTGVTMELVGSLAAQHTDRDFTMRLYPFPLPRDPQQGWIGVLYGQTRSVSTLRKTVSFHGENRKTFALQLIESKGKIESWRAQVTLKKEEAGQAMLPPEDPSPGETPGKGSFYEGQLMGAIALPESSLSLATRDLSASFYKPQRDLAIGQDGKGHWFAVAALGDPDTQDTDLWGSSSPDGKNWSALERLPVNSQSADWSPRLVKGEDGSQLLAWISQRRGKGWELWFSKSTSLHSSWTSPRRIPLEQLGLSPWQETDAKESWFIDYDITQDRRGRWLVAFQANSESIIILSSRDLDRWERFVELPTAGRIRGFALRQDGTELYHLAGVSATGPIRFGTSKNGREWDISSIGAGARYPPAHRMELLPMDGGMVRLFSDKGVGPRVSFWHPNDNNPTPILIARTRLESMSGTRGSDGFYWLVFREKNHLFVRRYKEFRTRLGDKDSGDTNVFVTRDYETDADGNRWSRAYPSVRFIVPDVTAVGAEPPLSTEERLPAPIWFGIETGAFFHRGDVFNKTDVTQGFFDHFVTDIAACRGLPVLFSSRDRLEPTIGMAKREGQTHRFSSEQIPNATGSIMGMVCGRSGEAFVDTFAGETWKLVTTGWIREKDRSLGPLAKKAALIQRIKNPVYPSIGQAVKDPSGGIWYLPADDIPSKGVAYFDGKTNKLYNPPHAILAKPSGLAVDHHGVVWIGTWFNGLYKMEKSK